MLSYRAWSAWAFVLSIGFVACSGSNTIGPNDAGGSSPEDATMQAPDGQNPLDAASQGDTQGPQKRRLVG